MATIAAAVASDAAAPARQAVIDGVTSGAVPLLAVTAPGGFRLKKVKEAIEKCAELKAGHLYAIITALTAASSVVSDAVSGDSEALVAFVNEQPEAIRSDASFARSLVAEAVFVAVRDEAFDAGLAAGGAGKGLAVAVHAATAAAGEANANAVAAYVVTGAQIAASVDEAAAPEAPLQAFQALAKASEAVAVLNSSAFKAWLSLKLAAFNGQAVAIGTVAESNGRSAAEKAAAEWVKGL